MTILGIKITGHDTGASLISDGRIVAISEERLNRVKHSRDMYPHLSVSYCLNALKVMPEQIDMIVMDEIDTHDTDSITAIFRKENKLDFSKAELRVINHHLAHAASAFFASPFEEAAILVVDGTGSKIKTHLGVLWETDSLYAGFGNEIRELQKTLHPRIRNAFIETFGIGKLYTLITRSYLNFGRYNEGKTMGLASYGDARRIYKQVSKEQWMKELNGHFVCNPKVVIPGFWSAFPRRLFSDPKKVLAMWRVRLFANMRSVALRVASFFGLSPEPIFAPIRLPFLPRENQKLPHEPYNDIAAVVQDLIEDVFLGLSRRASTITQSKNLCIAGGCGLNGVSNNKILQDKRFEHIFIQPASSDAGIPLGCALWGYYGLKKQKRDYVMSHAYLGREYTESEILDALKHTAGITYKKSVSIADDTARLLKEEKIIGWFQGRSEYGPRALGSRSILCNPQRKEMKDILNERVKHREGWRPFAASILKERACDYFEFEYEESPFMLMVPQMRENKKKSMGALVHIDGTCRIQTVTKEDNGIYYDLIKAFERQTGLPLVLNTSFNLAGEPIIETPHDALKCFLSTELDYLVLGNYIIEKH